MQSSAEFRFLETPVRKAADFKKREVLLLASSPPVKVGEPFSGANLFMLEEAHHYPFECKYAKSVKNVHTSAEDPVG